MRVKDLEIINQLETDIDRLDKMQFPIYLKTTIGVAMNGIRDGNYRFACERLAIVIEHVLGTCPSYKDESGIKDPRELNRKAWTEREQKK
ncbi:MAG: hypothetical protein J7K94_03095 [Dehalococcoidia bacterium]|nr:hypothetical protein [Dehalococcoidia bacterium]